MKCTVKYFRRLRLSITTTSLLLILTLVSQVWDVAAKTLLMTFEGHSSSVESCVWSFADPSLLLTGSFDCTVRTWQLPTALQYRLEVEHEKKSNSKKSHTVIPEMHLESQPKFKQLEDIKDEEIIEVYSEEDVKVEITESGQYAELEVFVEEHFHCGKSEFKQDDKTSLKTEKKEEGDSGEEEDDFSDSDDLKGDVMNCNQPQEIRKRMRKKIGKGRKKPIATEIRASVINKPVTTTLLDCTASASDLKGNFRTINKICYCCRIIISKLQYLFILYG